MAARGVWLHNRWHYRAYVKHDCYVGFTQTKHVEQLLQSDFDVFVGI